jgi:hypothetical protein
VENASGVDSARLAAPISFNSLPHSPQNLSCGWFGAPHLEQVIASGAPHTAQNLRPSRLSLLHFEQRILLYSGCAGVDG